MNFDIDKAAELATDLVRIVGARIKLTAEKRMDIQTRAKGISDPVTNVDIWSENYITEAVEKNFPLHLVVGEETSAQLCQEKQQSLAEIIENNVCWVVDPLDGTNNFINRIPYSAVSIALVVKGQAEFGVVFDPFRSEIFSAHRNKGAFLNGERINPSDRKKAIDCLVAVGFPNDRWRKWDDYRPAIDAIIMNFRNVRAYGASTIDFCWVACGRLDGVFHYNLKPWDVAASALIVSESGAFASSLNNSEERFELISNAFLAANPHVYREFCDIVSNARKV